MTAIFLILLRTMLFYLVDSQVQKLPHWTSEEEFPQGGWDRYVAVGRVIAIMPRDDAAYLWQCSAASANRRPGTRPDENPTSVHLLLCRVMFDFDKLAAPEHVPHRGWLRTGQVGGVEWAPASWPICLDKNDRFHIISPYMGREGAPYNAFGEWKFCEKHLPLRAMMNSANPWRFRDASPKETPRFTP